MKYLPINVFCTCMKILVSRTMSWSYFFVFSYYFIITVECRAVVAVVGALYWAFVVVVVGFVVVADQKALLAHLVFDVDWLFLFVDWLL